MADSNLQPVKPLSQLSREQQMELMSAEQLQLGTELLTIEEDSKAGRYTGERLAKHRERYDAIVVALGQGESVRSIARRLNASPSSVMKIRENEGESIEALKKETAATLRRFAHIGAERMLESVEAVKLESLPLAIAIASDKADSLQGEPSVRVRVDHHHHDVHVEANEAIDLLPDDVTVRETDSEARRKLAKARPVAELGADSARNEGAADNQSSLSDA